MANFIHPTAIIDSNVILGNNNYIGPYCHITGNTTIGDNNRFESYCSVGSPAEHREHFKSTLGQTIIGNNNIFREFITINSGTKDITTLQDNIQMLRNSHIGHDCIIENNVTLSCNVLLGGHSYVMEGVNFGLGSIFHQFSIIGTYSMIGMGSIITKKSTITPGNIFVGSPVKLLKPNITGLDRNNITITKLDLLKIKYTKLCQQ